MIKALVVAMAFSGLLFADATTTGTSTHKVAGKHKAKKAKGPKAAPAAEAPAAPAPTTAPAPTK